MRGREIENTNALGDFLYLDADHRYIIARGKFRGAYADTIPRGYIRNFILKTCRDELTNKELELFTGWSQKEEPLCPNALTAPQT